MAGSSDVAKMAGVKSDVVAAVVEAILDITNAGDKINIKGFGTFERKETAARMGRNPATGEDVSIPAKSKLTFKASKETTVVLAPVKKAKKK